MRRICHEVDYEILGHDIQIVEVELDRNETVVAEAGAMTYMEENIDFQTRMGDGSEPDQGMMGKLFSAGKRVLTGESIFTTHFTNTGTGKRRVAFSAPYPGTVVALDMAEVGGELVCQKDAFLAAAQIDSRGGGPAAAGAVMLAGFHFDACACFRRAMPAVA